MHKHDEARVHRILVVEDDPDIRELIVHVLEGEDREVAPAATGAQALAAVRERDPDLVTLDLTLPDADGVEVCRAIRQDSDAYIVMITGRDEQVDRLAGLDVGADEYLVKPFDPLELRARVVALLRRPRRGIVGEPAPAPAPHDLGGGLRLDRAGRSVSYDGVVVPLSPTEYDVLAVLASRQGSTVARADLAAEVWAGESIDSDFGVDVHVGGLRRKLRRAAPGRDWVRTVGGDGYQLREP
ncbi:response regulator transcription factor [Nocardioides panaciterrulae]|uniref:DNA-binding response OmpR family regulator n=1 Tax=Nocardioides panaciterrulae TaxID=661492 RepID=A0A7Y9E5L5_9ACTN|nr:response regulator transcription factor [Nocardioides panaciterrulae]NYD41681.1 DNA-binding response OmpR family regulator [Nocardioides panaciterrulae]